VLPADQIRALLREFDDPHRLERPRDFDLEASARRFAQLTRALVERFGPSCRSGLNQDTSDYGGISVPAEATGLGRPLWVGMSTFGCFVTAGRTSDSAAEISADIAAARGGRPLRLGGAASVPGRFVTSTSAAHRPSHHRQGSVVLCSEGADLPPPASGADREPAGTLMFRFAHDRRRPPRTAFRQRSTERRSERSGRGRRLPPADNLLDTFRGIEQVLPASCFCARDRLRAVPPVRAVR
jgi:hypothetical protein